MTRQEATARLRSLRRPQEASAGVRTPQPGSAASEDLRRPQLASGGCWTRRPRNLSTLRRPEEAEPSNLHQKSSEKKKKKRSQF